MQEMQVWSLGQEDPLEEEMATHSSFLAWEISWTEEPGELKSMCHKELDKTETTDHAYMHIRETDMFLALLSISPFEFLFVSG